MNSIVVILLVVLWLAFLSPSLARARREASPLRTIGRLHRSWRRSGLGLGRSRARSVLVLPGPDELEADPAVRTTRERRRLLASLAGTTAACGLLGALVGGFAWVLLGLSLAAFTIDVAVLVVLAARRDEVRRKLRHLPDRTDGDPDPGEGDVALPRTASEPGG